MVRCDFATHHRTAGQGLRAADKAPLCNRKYSAAREGPRGGADSTTWAHMSLPSSVACRAAFTLTDSPAMPIIESCESVLDGRHFLLYVAAPYSAYP